MIGYKLTTQDKKTRKGYPNIGVTHTEGELCSNGWIHFYPDPYLAVLRNLGDARMIKFAELCAREAILCAKKVYKEEKWNKWADSWLSGEDRSASYAYATSASSSAAFYAASYAADAASCAAYAYHAAHYACAAAFYAHTDIDFLKLIKEALKT